MRRFFSTFFLAFWLTTASAEPDPLPKRECAFRKIVHSQIADFLYSEIQKPDPFLGITPPQRGEPVKMSITFKGAKIPLFKLLGSGGDSTSYLGILNGKVVVVKKLKPSTPLTSLQREVVLSGFLSKKGFRTSPVIDSSEKDRILIKEFVNGFELKELDAAISRIPQEKFLEAKESLSELREKLARYQRTPAFKDFCGRRGIPPFIDLDESNLFFENGRWTFIDP